MIHKIKSVRFNVSNSLHLHPTRDDQLKELKKEHFDIKSLYVVAAKSLEHANELLDNACSHKNIFVILGPAMPWEGARYACCDELSDGHGLFTFLLKKNYGIDGENIYRKFPRKILGYIENGHFALASD